MQMPLLSLKNDRYPLLFESEDPGEVWKLFCELQSKLPKALLFITKDLNSAAGCKFIGYMTFSIYNPEGGCNNLPFGKYVKKKKKRKKEKEKSSRKLRLIC